MNSHMLFTSYIQLLEYVIPPGVNLDYGVRGCSHITSAAGGGEGVRQMLTISDEGGRGVQPNADHC